MVLVGLPCNVVSVHGMYGNNNEEVGKHGKSLGGSCVYKECVLGSTSHPTLAN